MGITHLLALVLLEGILLPYGVPALVNFENAALATITRQNNGDTFQATGVNCNPDTCVGLSSGTAALATEESPDDTCTCQCHRHLPAFREDLQICVDDIHECVLAPFISGSMSQQIPFVFLPLKGQIIHPSKEISFTGVVTPICAVSGAKFLTGNGWVDLRNSVDADVPFRLYRDEGRTFLQWEGESDLRNRMSGRLVLVHLLCRELGANQEPPQSVFSPCVAFRVVGTPTKYSSNISEVMFTPDSQASEDSQGTGLSISEIIAIGICSVLLGLIYVASIFLYLHLRKKRRDAEKIGTGRGEANLSDAEEGIIKSNPLLGLDRHFGTSDNCFTDSTGSDTDVTPDILQHHDDRKKGIQITSALVHSYHHDPIPYSSLQSLETCPQDSASIERLPEENVSIIETLEGREDRPENVRSIGTTRKKLYFNPAYFEPHLLVTPPPAAIEFLTKIREVITIAKQKMAAKKFTPNLMGIPEEDSSVSLEVIYGYSRDTIISLKRENSRRRICSGCPGCEPQDFKPLCGKLPEFPSLAACENCSLSSADSKQRSIRKWLEDIPVVIKPMINIEEQQQQQRRLRTPRTYFPKAMSEKAPTPDGIYEDAAPSIVSHPPGKPRLRNRRPRRKPIVKPKAPPPPLPTMAKLVKPKQNNYETITSSTLPLPPPDMIHEAMAVENRNEEVVVGKIPTVTKKKMNAVINEFATQHGIDSTTKSQKLDYSSPKLSNNKKKLVDYETDSLERTARISSDSSSQPSPSLSAALPMDEEMTMRNDIINAKTGSMTISKLNMGGLLKNPQEDDGYELIVTEKTENVQYQLPELLQNGNLVTEVYVNNGYNYGSTPSSISSNCSTLERKQPPMVRYEKNQPGHLLIEVVDCADHYIKVEDSDSFEPDTLDRKPTNKFSLRQNELEFVDSLERPNQILLRTTGTFRNESLSMVLNNNNNNKEVDANFSRKLGSLREIYEAKIRKSVQGKFDDKTEVVVGRILTLEERHSKRQRKSNANGIPPDVIPPQQPIKIITTTATEKPIYSNEDSPIYEQPKPPRKVDDDQLAKPPLPPKNATLKKKQGMLMTSAKCDAAILKNFIHNNNDVVFKNGINNQLILQATTTTTTIPTPSPKQKDINWTFKPPILMQKYPDDAGYLSTDSNESRKKKPKETEGGGGGGSETDESLCDGHSESGAESIETHSVFFDSFRKPSCLSGSLDSGVDSDLKVLPGAVLDDGASSDSENMSFKTVVTTRKY